MIDPKKIDLNKLKTQLQVKKPWDIIIISFLNLVITFPIFIIIHHNVIDFNWPFNLDRILIFLLVFIVIHFVLNAMRTFMMIAILIYFFVLIYGSIFGNYGFNSVV